MSADFFEEERHCTLLGLVRALDVPSQDRQGHAAARLCLCWILRWDTQKYELVLQQSLRTSIPSCVSRKHLASLKIPKCTRESEMGKHLPLLGGCRCFIPRTSSSWLCQRGHGREWRQSWAFLYIFPHVTEFLRFLLLLQHRARDDKCCHPCVTPSLHIQPSFVLAVPVLCMCACPPLHALRDACQGLPSILSALLWTSEQREESLGQQMSAQAPD